MTAVKPRSTAPLLGFIFLGLVALAAWPLVALQTRLDVIRSKQSAEESIKYLPSGRFLSTAVLGYDNLVADLLWVRGIALFGEKYKATQDEAWYRWLFQLIDVASDLDPRDVRIYKYGGLMLRLNSALIDQSTYIFHKGIEYCPQEFFLPFGIAMNYFELKNDPRKAAEYMKMAATRKNAPFYLRNLAATMLDQTRQGETAITFLREQLQQLSPGSLQYRAVEVKILEVVHDEGARRLQEAAAGFLSIYNRPPRPLREVEGKTLHQRWPEDPYGGDYVLDPVTGRVRSSEYLRARAQIRKEVGLGLGEEEETKTGPGIKRTPH